jgi:hypothetical protein
MIGKTRRRARVGGLLGTAVAFALVANSCTRPGSTPPGGSYVSQVNAQGTSHWTCTSNGLGGNMEGEHNANGNALANNAYAGKHKGTLSLADCKRNAQLFDDALAYATKYPTKGSAEQAGYTEMVQFIAGMGSHNMTLSFGGPSSHPFFLQYDGEANSAPLAGMSWFTSSTLGPPSGFAGGNDWWHSHTSLCYTGKAALKDILPGAPWFGVAGNEITDAACQAKGGVNLKLPGIWMAHAWIVPGYEDRYDVFAGASACIQGSGRPPSADDPCHLTPMEMDHGNGGGTPTTRRGTVTTRRGVTTTTMGSMPGMDHSH